jgi:hypothetical protein
MALDAGERIILRPDWKVSRERPTIETKPFRFDGGIQ